MKKCRRCKQDWPDQMFQAPVSICLACYWVIPENRELTIEQLREKASRSKYAKRAKGSRYRAELAKQILPAVFNIERQENKLIASRPTGGIRFLHGTCERCNREIYIADDVVTWKFNDRDEEEEAKLWCVTCAVVARNEMKKTIID